MNNDLNRALMHTENVIRRAENLRRLFRQIDQCLSVAQDQLIAIDHSAERMGVKR